MELSPPNIDSELLEEVSNNYNPKRNAATFDWKVSLINSPNWSDTNSSLSCSPEQDKVELDEEGLIDQLYNTRITDTKFTAMRLLTKDSVCVYCGVHVNNNSETWNQKVCSLCSEALNSNQSNDKKLNKRHGIQFMALQSDQCRACRQPVNDACIEALGYRWHPHHFTCTHCHSTITEYIDHLGMPYCERDFQNLFGINCQRCQLPITEDHVAALDTTWHIDCFTCQECYVSTPACHSLNKKLLCEIHYYAHHQLICQLCDNPLKSKYLASRASKFHPHHFNCHACKDPLDDHMRIKNDILFCSHCLS